MDEILNLMVSSTGAAPSSRSRPAAVVRVRPLSDVRGLDAALPFAL